MRNALRHYNLDTTSDKYADWLGITLSEVNYSGMLQFWASQHPEVVVVA